MNNRIDDLLLKLKDILGEMERELDLYGEIRPSLISKGREILVGLHCENVWHPGLVIEVEASDSVKEITDSLNQIWDTFTNGPIIETMLAREDDHRFWREIVKIEERLFKIRPMVVTSDPSIYGFATFYSEAVKSWTYGLNRSAAILCCSAIEEVITGELSKEEEDFAISLTYANGFPSGILERTFYEIIQAAHDRGYLTEEQFEQAEHIRLTRNRILHEMESVSEDESLDLINATRSVIQSLLSESRTSSQGKYFQSDYQTAFMALLHQLRGLIEKLMNNPGEIYELNDDQEESLKKLFKMNIWNPGEIVQVDPAEKNFADELIVNMLFKIDFTPDRFEDLIYKEDSEKFYTKVLDVVDRLMRSRPAFVTIDPTRYDFIGFNKEAVLAWALGLNKAAFVLCVSTLEDVIGGELIKKYDSAPLHLVYEDDQVTGLGKSKIRDLMRKATKHGIIDQTQSRALSKLVTKRNRILHQFEEVGSKETYKAINRTRALIEEVLTRGQN